MPEEPATESPDNPCRCRNCGTELGDAFCPHCGQKAEHWLKPLREMVGELADGFLAFDARIWRTIGPLVLKPGWLTLEYFAGRRVRYVPPLRLYLFFSFVFFVTLALLPSQNVVVETETGQNVDVGAVHLNWNRGETADEGEVGAALESEAQAVPDSGQGEADNPGPISEENVARIAADPARFYRMFADKLAQIAFLLVPFFAAYLKLFYWRQRSRLYAHHLVFSLHLHAFGFAAAWLQHLTGLLPGVWAESSTIFGLALLIYPPLAMRRAYGQSWFWTLTKYLGLGGLYAITLGLASLAAVLLALRAW